MSKRIAVTITDDQYATLLKEVKDHQDELIVTNRKGWEQAKWVTPSVVIQAALNALGDGPSSGREIRSRYGQAGWGGHRDGAGRRAKTLADEPGGP